METTIVYWGYIGIMEKKMETTGAYGGYIGIICPASFKSLDLPKQQLMLAGFSLYMLNLSKVSSSEFRVQGLGLEFRVEYLGLRVLVHFWGSG